MSGERRAENGSALKVRNRPTSPSGIDVIHASNGAAIVSLKIGSEVTDMPGTTGAGVVAASADSAFGLACNSRGEHAVAFYCSITFAEHVRAGETLTATAFEVIRSGRTCIYDVKVSAGAHVVARFKGHSRTLESAVS